MNVSSDTEIDTDRFSFRISRFLHRSLLAHPMNGLYLLLQKLYASLLFKALRSISLMIIWEKLSFPFSSG